MEQLVMEFKNKMTVSNLDMIKAIKYSSTNDISHSQRVLWEMATKDYKSKYEELINLLDKTDIETCCNIIFFLCTNRVKKALPLLLDWLKNNKQPRIREQIALYLVHFNKVKIIQELISAYKKETSIRVKGAILMSWTKIDPEKIQSIRKDIIEILINSLSSPYHSLRHKALLAFEILGDSASSIHLIPMLKDKHRRVRAAAAKAIGKHTVPGGFTSLCMAMGDKDIEVCHEIAKALLNYNAPGTENILLGLVMDSRPLSERFSTTYRWLRRSISWTTQCNPKIKENSELLDLYATKALNEDFNEFYKSLKIKKNSNNLNYSGLL